MAQGHLDDVLVEYRTELAIMEPLADRDRSNTDWQRFISVVYGRIGIVFVKPGKSGRIEARTGLRMMPTSPRSPYHSVRRVFPSTAGRMAFRTAPSQRVAQFKPAPGIR